ncbi:murein L,D-transpeptidase catalytic domain family protein [Sphingomonas sp.]|uniref:murein L,D-transpeptidase catalytic domain family protein n=1 Tax=Sphingomonas sp. TaxID=28214 RepID=UPI002C4586BE|nr:murein L,D-transpeptidase catalytic domain family protein [Sphingomonas sp.]HTG37468.1 murein L,D-transpeptidase catalytic domain family protein [Sphingomonas sp.]
MLRAGGITAAAIFIPGCMREAAAPVSVAQKAPPPVAPGPAPVPAQPAPPPRIAGVSQSLVERAVAARDKYGDRLRQRDKVAIVDFSHPSYRSRLALVDLANGRVDKLLVAHGIGSDPGHTAFLQRFSNENGSEATCEGAFIATDYYIGQHDRSQRLVGLDPTNSNAMARAIVIHGAWYANKDMLSAHGKLGRSQGCFAVGEAELQRVFDHLGEGALVYAAKG